MRAAKRLRGRTDPFWAEERWGLARLALTYRRVAREIGGAPRRDGAR
jgi:hypothetical protein